jgi:hypothetical protein
VGAENYVALCDLGIFVDQAAESISPDYTDVAAGGGRTGVAGWCLVQGLVWPVGVVVIDVVAGDEPWMPFTSDQHQVLALAAGAADPAFGDRVCAWRLHACLDDAHAGGGEHGVEGR